MTNGKLKPCPSSPNCVSSQADPHNDTHHIEPIAIAGETTAAWARVAAAIRDMPRAAVIKEEDGYLHAEFTSRIFRFVDDVELILDRDNQVIHCRSASRTGYSDMGVNRERMEAIRKAVGG